MYVLVVFTGLVNLSCYLCKDGPCEECVVHLVSALPILREAKPTSCFTANGRNALLLFCACVCQSAGYYLS